MTKSYDIRNIYVATIAKQGKVRTYVKREAGFLYRDIFSKYIVYAFSCFSKALKSS